MSGNGNALVLVIAALTVLNGRVHAIKVLPPLEHYGADTRHDTAPSHIILTPGRPGLFPCSNLSVLNAKLTTVTAQGFTNITLTPLNNGHLGSALNVDCLFTFTDDGSIGRKVHFYRKRQNEDFAEIANTDILDNPVFRWNDTALQSRSDFTMVNKSMFRITIRSLECRDKAEYRCMYFVGNRNGDFSIMSEEKALDITGSCAAPGDC